MSSPHLRIVCFDDESGDFFKTKVADCARDLGIECTFRHYFDDWLHFAEEEGRERDPALWLVDLRSNDNRNRGGTRAWERINGWRDADEKLNELFRRSSTNDNLRSISQGVAVLLYAGKLRADAHDRRARERVRIRVCTNYAPETEFMRLVAYAATGDASKPFEEWGIDKVGLRVDDKPEQHLKALESLKNNIKEMAFPKAEPLPIPERWPRSLRFVYPSWWYVRHHLPVMGLGGLAVGVISAYLTWITYSPKAPMFEDVLFHHNGHTAPAPECILGRCGPAQEFERALDENDSVDLEGSIGDAVFVKVIAVPEAKMPDFGEQSQFKAELSTLKGRLGLNMIAVLVSHKPLIKQDLTSIERQLNAARVIDSVKSNGPFICDGIVSLNNGGSRSVARGCEILGEFISKDSRNRYALLVAFPVKSPEPVPIK